jgi:hypothetical protein
LSGDKPETGKQDEQESDLGKDDSRLTAHETDDTAGCPAGGTDDACVRPSAVRSTAAAVRSPRGGL